MPLCLLALHPEKRLARKSETRAWRPLGCKALPHNFRARQKLHFSHLKTIEIKIIWLIGCLWKSNESALKRHPGLGEPSVNDADFVMLGGVQTLSVLLWALQALPGQAALCPFDLPPDDLGVPRGVEDRARGSITLCLLEALPSREALPGNLSPACGRRDWGRAPHCTLRKNTPKKHFLPGPQISKPRPDAFPSAFYVTQDTSERQHVQTPWRNAGGAPTPVQAGGTLC